MKFLSPRAHGVLDYGVVLIFLAAPRAAGFAGIAATISYALAVVHLAVTLISDFPLGKFKILPLAAHGWIELAVAPTLAATPWIFGFAAQDRARLFYVAIGGVIFAAWLATNYRNSKTA